MSHLARTTDTAVPKRQHRTAQSCHPHTQATRLHREVGEGGGGVIRRRFRVWICKSWPHVTPSNVLRHCTTWAVEESRNDTKRHLISSGMCCFAICVGFRLSVSRDEMTWPSTYEPTTARKLHSVGPPSVDLTCTTWMVSFLIRNNHTSLTWNGKG
jgi:hypothetical protein